MGHAVAICEARGALWSWDSNFGWSRLGVDPAQRENVTAIAPLVLQRYPKINARFPAYRFDFPQQPSGAPPTARFTESNPSVRDASIVGAHLARRRSVNVVTFSFGTEDDRHDSAAAVFVFHGRYCVYVPEFGTIPFRVRGDVANVRLIQDLLRRCVPNVTGVRKL